MGLEDVKEMSFKYSLVKAFSAKTTPAFSPDGSRYDQSTYEGRFMGFLDIVDPRMMLVTEEEIKKSEQLLQQYSEKSLSESVTDEELWQAKKVIEAVTNKGTGERIPPPLRMSGFVPANIPLVAGMLNSTSVAGTLFWQWANQSYNSATNYANRSGSSMSMEEIMTSYGIAVGTSCGLALAFRWLGNNGPALFRTVAKVPFVVPYIAVGAAGAANVYFSRKPEMDNGVVVKDAAGKELGVSREAGKQGVMKTILSRSLGLPIPVMVLPALIMSAMPKTLPKRTLMVAELFAITGALCFALPATLAIFPQTLELDAKSLEPEFHNLVDANGNPITKVYSNKGL